MEMVEMEMVGRPKMEMFLKIYFFEKCFEARFVYMFHSKRINSARWGQFQRGWPLPLPGEGYMEFQMFSFPFPPGEFPFPGEPKGTTFDFFDFSR